MAFARTGFAGFQYGSASGPYDAASRRRALDRLDMLATAFDTAFILPGTNVRFGVESLLRLVPGVGDVAASLLSFYLLYEASRLGVPRLLLARMAANVVLEGAVGAVPFAGDAFDIFFHANRRNVALLPAHFAGSTVLGVVLHPLLLARARDSLDLGQRAAGFFGDLAVLLDQKAVRRLVAVDAAEQRARNFAVGALRAVFIDDVEHDEFGIQSRFSRHDCSPYSCCLILILCADSCSSHMTENKTPASL